MAYAGAKPRRHFDGGTGLHDEFEKSGVDRPPLAPIIRAGVDGVHSHDVGQGSGWCGYDMKFGQHRAIVPADSGVVMLGAVDDVHREDGPEGFGEHRLHGTLKGVIRAPCYPTPEGPQAVRQQKSKAVHLSEAVEAQAAPWKKLWRVDEQPFDVADIPVDAVLPFVMPTVADIRATTATYSWHTAVGADHWSPRHIGLLSLALIHL